MCEAEVGDEQKHEDPTVNLLQEMVADLLGKEAAVFLPSGTMCNEIALRVHCRPGEEMLAHRTAHPIHFESGGPAALAGVNVRPLDGPRGQYDAATLEAAIRPDNRHFPRSRLVWVEQTCNLGGGSIWPLDARARGHRRGAPPPARHPPGRRAAHERRRRLRRRGPRVGGALRLGVDRLHQGARAPRWAPRSPARAISSPRRGASSSRWAGPCGRPASSPPAACTRSGTTSSGWPRTTPTRGGSPRGWPRCPASRSIRRPWRRTSSSST